MNIAICDDEPVQLMHIHSLAEKWSTDSDICIQVSLFSNADELLFNYTPGRYDVLLLDIQMEGENGISLAKKIRRCNDGAAIVFITAVSDYVFDGYDVGAVQYLLKPVDEYKLFECLETAHKKRPDSGKLIFETEEGSMVLPENEILYFEACSHKTKIVLNDKELLINQKFSDAAERLSDCFYQCHRSYIVNMKHVNSIKKYAAVLDCGADVPVSRRIYNDFNRAFIAFYRR